MESKRYKKNGTDIRTLKDQLKAIPVDLALIAPPGVQKWLILLSETSDTQPMMLMTAILPAVAALMGSTKIKSTSKKNPEVLNYSIYRVIQNSAPLPEQNQLGIGYKRLSFMKIQLI